MRIVRVLVISNREPSNREVVWAKPSNKDGNGHYIFYIYEGGWIPITNSDNIDIDNISSDSEVSISRDSEGKYTLYLNSNTKKLFNNTFSSLLELKDYKGILSEGTTVCTNGYYNENDGGAARYVIKNHSDSFIYDTGSCIELSNGQAAILIAENGEVNALQFGAKSCNYWSDFYDSTQNLQDALNYVSYYVQTDVNKTNYKVGRLLINGTFFTRELTLTSNNNNNKIEIMGYSPFLSELMYIGDRGYSGDSVNFDTDSYIFKVKANNQLHILNIGFNGALYYKDESRLKSVASYGLIIESYYGWGIKIEGCYFTQFVMSGLYINCSLLNGYLLNNRWDIAGKNYIYIKDITSLKINNFAIDSKFHNFKYRNTTFKNIFKSIPWCKDMGTEVEYPSVGNTFLYIERIGPCSALQIDTARVEDETFVTLKDSKSSFVTIEKCEQLQYNYKSSIKISNINFALGKLYCLVKLKTKLVNYNPRLLLTGVNTPELGNIIPIYYESEEISQLNKVYSGTQSTPISPTFSYLSKLCDNQNINSTNTFLFNGVQFGVQQDIEGSGYFKYNDIIFNTTLLNGAKKSDKYNCVGYSCVRPLIGYGDNTPSTWFPASFNATIDSDKNIITEEKLNVNVSYTITYSDGSTEDVCCTECIQQEDGNFISKFEYTPISKEPQSVTMQVTKCEWRPFGKRELLGNVGTTGNRPNKGLIEGDMYIDKTLGKPVWYINNKWVDSSGNEV